MEAVPRLPMIHFELKISPDRPPFEFVKLKQYIREFYNEDPEMYMTEIRNLESLRATAIRPVKDVAGCSVLKKYFCQLHFLQSRFPMGKDGKAAISFSWKDTYGQTVTSACDIKAEMVSILYNIGALHSQLGAGDDRTSPEGLKMACSHFQCGAWAFQHLKDSYPQPAGIDMSPDLMQYKYQLCLAQAQECILEKSMTDNRKATINAKVATQIVDYYNLALNSLLQPPAADDCAIVEIVGSKNLKNWKKYMKFKVAYYTCISLLYQGLQSEEQQKMGERVTFYQEALQKLNEAIKLSKGIDQADAVMETLVFTRDVVEAKRKAAKNENEFIYHEEIPELDSLPNIKGASLVKGIGFNFNDPEISGTDIFSRLVPMKAHEASSLYSEEKAKLLRRMSSLIDSKDEEVVSFMSCLQLEHIKAHLDTATLPQEVVDRCAALNAMPDAIPNLMSAMEKLNEAYHSVDATLKEINELIKIEEVAEKDYQEVMGSRPPSIVATDMTREANKYTEAHKKAAESNETLHKAMTQHIENLRVLQQPLRNIQSGIPSLTSLNLQEDQTLNDVIMLVNKVNEMRKQRAMLASQLRESVCSDDITGQLIVRVEEKMEDIFAKEMQKHNKYVTLIEQNLAAQENILQALTDAYANYAPTRKVTSEVMKQRDLILTALISSYDAYEDLLSKFSKGQEFYRKLETNLTKLSQRVKGTCKVQQEERDTILEQNAKKALKASEAISSGTESVKLKHYLQTKQMESAAVPTSNYYSSAPNSNADNVQTWLPSVRPAPVGSEGTAPVCTGTSKPSDYTPQSTSGFNSQTSPYYTPYLNPATFNSYQDYHTEAAKSYANTQAYYYQSLYAQNNPLKLLQYPSLTDQTASNLNPDSSKYDNFTSNPYNYPKPNANVTSYNFDHTYAAALPSQQTAYPATSTPQPSASPVHTNITNQAMQNYTAPYMNGTYQYPPGSTQQYPTVSTQQTTQYTTDAAQNFVGSQQTSQYPTDTNQQSSQYPAGATQQRNQYPTSTAQPISQYSTSSAQQNTQYPTTGTQQNAQNLSGTTQYPTPANQQNTQYPTPANQQNTQYPTPANQQNTQYPTTANQQSAQYPTTANQQSSQYPTTANQQSTQYPTSSAQQNTQYPVSSTTQNSQYLSNTVEPNYNKVPTDKTGVTNYASYGGYAIPDATYSNYFNMQTASVPTTQNTWQILQQGQKPSENPQQASQQTMTQQQLQQYYQTYGTNAASGAQPAGTQPYSAENFQTYNYSNTYPKAQFQQTPGTATSFYSSAGSKNTSDTNSTMSPQGSAYSVPYNTDNQSALPNYYTQPYGYQYYQGSLSGPSSGGVPVENLQVTQPVAKQNTVTYMQASNSKTDMTITYSQQEQKKQEKTSNVDLLAGLDFTVSEAPLLPQPSIEALIDKSQEQIANLSIVETTKPTSETNTIKTDEKSLDTAKPEVVERPSPSKTPSKDPFSDSEALTLFVQEVEKFEKFVEGLNSKTLNGPTALDLKWNELQDQQEKDSHKLSISVARCYPMKNRFADILPYDNTRVELPSTKDDYINASFVKDLGGGCPNFIMTQSPLPSTYADFWSMVLEQHVELIICLLSESQLNNEIYWAKSKVEDLVLGKIKVSLQSSNVKNHWIERIFSVSEGKISRIVMHLEFTAWPHSWIPESPGPLLNIVSETYSVWSQQRGRGPVVVHCQSGVGRSGVFVFVALCMTELKIPPIHLPETIALTAQLAKLRKNPLRDRQHLLFAYQCLLYYAQDLLMKRGILASRSSFEEKRTKSKSHTRHPSEDFLLNSLKEHQERRTSDASSTGSSSRPSEGDPLSQIDPLWPIKRYS